MPSHDPNSASVTFWLTRLKQGDSQAGSELWKRYLQRLIGLARHKLGDLPRRVADEEDVVQLAFDGFFRGVEQQRFHQLNDRDDLWQVLVMLTERKAIELRRRQTAEKRGGGRVQGESALRRPGADDSKHGGIGWVESIEPSPEFAVDFADHVGTLLDRLQDDDLRQVVLAKLEGCEDREIARRLDMALRSVQRKLHLIRRTWEDLTP